MLAAFTVVGNFLLGLLGLLFLVNILHHLHHIPHVSLVLLLKLYLVLGVLWEELWETRNALPIVVEELWHHLGRWHLLLLLIWSRGHKVELGIVIVRCLRITQVVG